MALRPDTFAGKEMGGAEDTLANLYDPETNPNKDMPLDELERLIDGAPKESAESIVEDSPAETSTETKADPVGAVPQETREGAASETATEDEVTEEKAEPEKPSLDDRLAAFEEREAKRELELERLRLHNSRLAAKLGNAERKISERSTRRDSGDTEDDGLADIREEIASLKAERHADALSHAVNEEFTRFRARPDFVELTSQMQTLSPKFERRYEELAAIQDVTEARLAARELQLDLLAEARAEKIKTDRAEAERRKLDASTKLTSDKKKASVTESSVRGAAARPKAFDPETAPLEELEAAIDRDYGVQR